MRPLPTDQMFVGDNRDLRVRFTRQDDYDLDEMIGADTSYFDELSVSDLQEFGQVDLLPVHRRSHAHHLKTAFTGIVRGSIRPGDLRHEGAWVRITELLSVFNQHTKSRWAGGSTRCSHSSTRTISSAFSLRARQKIHARSTAGNRYIPCGSGPHMVTASTLTLMAETSLCVGSPWQGEAVHPA